MVTHENASMAEHSIDGGRGRRDTVDGTELTNRLRTLNWSLAMRDMIVAFGEEDAESR